MEQINRLLDNYWAGDTSLEEESALKAFFSQDAIPEELRKYQPLFSWKANQLLLKGDGILKAGRIKPAVHIRWYPILKIAASFLVILTLGIGIYTHYQQEKFLDTIFSDTYSNPEDALRETKDVIGKVSSILNLAKDKHIEAQKLDSTEEILDKNKAE